MAELLNLLSAQPANVSVTISLEDLREMAASIAEQVAERLRDDNNSEVLLTRKQVCDTLGVTNMTLYRGGQHQHQLRI